LSGSTVIIRSAAIAGNACNANSIPATKILVTVTLLSSGFSLVLQPVSP